VNHADFDVHNELEWIISSGDKVFLQVQNKDGVIQERWSLDDMPALLSQLGIALPH